MEPRLEPLTIKVKRGNYYDAGYFARLNRGGKYVADDKLSDRPVEEGGQKKGGELGGKEVQAKMDEETEKGYRGTTPDPTPNANYTVAGVTSGAPTPENNPEAAAEVGSGKFRDVNPEPAKPAEKVTLKNDDGREIHVSEKLKTNYPEYKGEAAKKGAK